MKHGHHDHIADHKHPFHSGGAKHHGKTELHHVQHPHPEEHSHIHGMKHGGKTHKK